MEGGGIARQAGAGVVIFAATLILLLGASSLLEHRPAAVRVGGREPLAGTERASPGATGAASGPAGASASGSASASGPRGHPAPPARRHRPAHPALAEPDPGAQRQPGPARRRRHRRLRDRRRRGDGAAARPAAGHRLHGRRQRPARRQREPVRGLLRADLGPPARPDPAGPRRTRLGHQGPRRLSRVLRGGRRAGRRHLVLVRPRLVAHRGPRLGLRGRRRLHRGQRPGPLAREGPRRVEGDLHPGDLAPAAGELRRRGRRPGRSRRSGRRCTPRTPRSSSTPTTATTSASRRRTRPATRTAPRGSASSSWAPAARRSRGFGPPAANSEFRLAGEHGVLRLILREKDYAWTFVPSDGTVTDGGQAACH